MVQVVRDWLRSLAESKSRTPFTPRSILEYSRVTQVTWMSVYKWYEWSGSTSGVTQLGLSKEVILKCSEVTWVIWMIACRQYKWSESTPGSDPITSLARGNLEVLRGHSMCGVNSDLPQNIANVIVTNKFLYSLNHSFFVLEEKVPQTSDAGKKIRPARF